MNIYVEAAFRFLQINNLKHASMKKLISILLPSLFTLAATSQTMLDTALNFTVKDVYGNTFTLFDKLDENKIVVIDFFSTS